MTILYTVTIIQTLTLILFVGLIYLYLKKVSNKYSKDISKNTNTLNYNNYELRYFLTKIHVGYDYYSDANISGVKTNEVSSQLYVKKK